ncbi:MAG: hypothetical protein ACT4NV_01350 [Rhodoferax sp.]
MHIAYDGLGWSWALAWVIASLGVLGTVVFALAPGAPGAWSAVAATAAWSAAVLAWMRWHACPGELSWDGGQWRWQAATQPQAAACGVRVCMDFNHWMLVRVRPVGRLRSRWLWLQRRHPAHWHLVRAVLCNAAQA